MYILEGIVFLPGFEYVIGEMSIDASLSHDLIPIFFAVRPDASLRSWNCSYMVERYHFFPKCKAVTLLSSTVSSEHKISLSRSKSLFYTCWY